MRVSSRFRGIVAVGLILTIVSSATAKYSGGTGEPNDPYRIATAADLIALGEAPEDYDKHFILTADIDLDPNLPGRKVFDKAVIAPEADDLESDFQGTAFTGVFDGNGHTISRLTIRGVSYVGLFGVIEGAEIIRLRLLDVDIAGSGDHVGGLAGANGRWSNTRATIVRDCCSTGAVVGGDRVGALVGINCGYITRCYAADSVTGDSFVGGLVGWNYDENDDQLTRITYCRSTCLVSGSGSYVGGLAGKNSGTITCCYSTGAVSSIGMWSEVGGLAGENEGDLTCCYSTGAVSGVWRVGGLVGSNDTNGIVTRCFWDTQTSGQPKSAGGIGRITNEMQAAGTFLDAGWDFLGERTNGLHEIWYMPQGGGYPSLAILSGFAPAQLEGTGTAEGPYLISDGLELGAMVHYSPDAHYRLATSIDLSGINWSVPVIPRFAGSFDGNNLTISHLTIISTSKRVGFFGKLDGGAEVKNLGIVNVNITGSGLYVGGLAGSNGHAYGHEGGTIRRCYSSGTVSGAGYVGGLLGENYGYSANVVQSYSSSAVTGQNGGGLVGWNDGAIECCYSTGAVSVSGNGGGLVAVNGGRLTNCYSTGAISGNGGGLVWGPGRDFYGQPIQDIITDCFWDIEASGQMTSHGGTGKTTAEMQTANTFLAWGCDPAVWTIDEGVDYPALAWEGKPGTMLPDLAVFLTGSGGQDDPYLIFTADDINAIGLFPCAWDKHFKLMADIDLSLLDGRDGRPAYNIIAPDADPCESGFQGTLFSGVFDGNGHILSHLTTIGKDYLGLFGQMAGTVEDLGIVDVNIIGSGDVVGGLVGMNRGNVMRCYCAGVVRGLSTVGGMVGYNYGGSVNECYSIAVVSGAGPGVGGLVGQNGWAEKKGDRPSVSGSVAHCYSASAVSGEWSVGGLVGFNSCGFVTRSYSTGLVSDASSVGGLVGTGLMCGDITASFWDTQTSGQTESAGGTGKTTIEMQTANTFLEAGWDFAGETANGIEDIWWILEGKDYPRLWWEAISDGVTDSKE